jgi:hypothetical protein
MKKKHICSHKNCSEIATWYYMPATDKPVEPYYCDSHVYRGCSCNYNHVNEDYPNNPIGVENIDFKWIKTNEVWVSIDESGRQYPCIEFDNSETGYYTNEYEQYLEQKCIERGYDILINNPDEQKFYEQFGHIVWTGDLIKKIEKELKLKL